MKSEISYSRYLAKKYDLSDDIKEEEAIAAGASKLTAQEFETFLSYLSKLEYLDLGDSRYFSFYMICLGDLENTQYLQHIKEISPSSGLHHDGREENHFKACHNFRTTLTYLSASHHKYSSYNGDYDDTTLNVLDSLSEFKQLEELKIIIDLMKI